jgi:hypothetical protein
MAGYVLKVTLACPASACCPWTELGRRDLVVAFTLGPGSVSVMPR